MFRRVWLLVAITTSVVLGPRLFPAPETPEPPVEVALAVGHPDLAVVPERQLSASSSPDAMVVLDGIAVSTTSTTAAPTTTTSAPPEPARTATSAEETTSTTAPRRPPSTTTTTAAPEPPSTTTTTAAAARTVPPAPYVEQSDGTQFGDVSWYDLEGARSGICAHRILDKGTVVTVTNLDTGASITCTVGDRGPYSGDDKVLDLYRPDFALLAPLEQGVITARLDW